MTNMSLRYRHRAALAALVVALISVACGGGGEEVTDDATGTPTPTATPSGDDATASPTPTESATATATETPAASPTSGPTQEPAAPPEMTITSPAFANGGQIPIRYTCDGANVSPPIVISDVPAEAVTLALVVDDPDAPAGTFDHWVRFDITPVDNLEEGASSAVSAGEVGTAGTNSFGNLLYGGPCPPDGSHRYVFQLFAVDGALDLGEGADGDALASALDGRVVASAELVGLYERLPAQPPAPGLDVTPVIGRVASAYKVSPEGQPVPYGFDELAFEPGTVEAHWYTSDDRYVVVYRGIDATTIGPLCPGNSIQTAAGFAHVSNSPSGEGGCRDDVPAPPAGVGVRGCGENLVYVTAIPTTESGNLYGTVEAFDDEGALLGVTSAVPTSLATTPAIDLDAFCSP